MNEMGGWVVGWLKKEKKYICIHIETIPRYGLWGSLLKST